MMLLAPGRKGIFVEAGKTRESRFMLEPDDCGVCCLAAGTKLGGNSVRIWEVLWVEELEAGLEGVSSSSGGGGGGGGGSGGVEGWEEPF